MSFETFRIAGELDAMAIAQLVNNAYRPELDSPGWTHESGLVSGSRTSVNQVAALISKPDSIILMGFKDSELVACVHVEKDGRNGCIGMLAVNPAVQRVGAGKQMLVLAEKYICENFGSEKFIMFVVSSRSELISFYMRRGYQKTGNIMNYPLSADFGTPIHPDLKIEVIEKGCTVTDICCEPKSVSSLTLAPIYQGLL